MSRRPVWLERSDVGRGGEAEEVRGSLWARAQEGLAAIVGLQREMSPGYSCLARDWSAEKKAGDQSAGRCRNPTDGGLGLEVAAKGMLSGRIQDIFGRQAQRIR